MERDLSELLVRHARVLSAALGHRADGRPILREVREDG
jgi:hypothetical protein